MAKKLYGTDPDQVPTNADLGTMAYTQVDNLPQISAKWVDVHNPTNRQSNLEIHTSDYYRDSGDPDLAYNWRFTNEGNAKRLRLMGVNPNMSPANIFPLYVEGDTEDIVLSGNVRVSNGKGIDFSASEGSGASSSVLDDYEEGTWTALFNIPSGSVTYHSSSGVYTKIGRMVHVSAWIYINVLSSPSGTLTLTLPFTNQGNVRASQVNVVNRWTGVTGQIGCWLSNSSSSLNFVTLNNGTMGASALNGTNMLTNGEMYINFSYET